MTDATTHRAANAATVATNVSGSGVEKLSGVLVELRHVTQEFQRPDGRPLRVLEDISLAVREHEVLALLGPSGCGKSTILRCIAGLLQPTSGTVVARGEQLTGLNSDAALVFQGFALYPWLTAADNIRVALEAGGAGPAEARRRTDAAMAMVGLSGFAGAYPRELSGGMKQRIGIARALAVDRALLLLDEPFSQIDALTAESLRTEVLDLWLPPPLPKAGAIAAPQAEKPRNPQTVVLVSHDIQEVVFMADRIVVLSANPGRVRTVVTNALPRPRDQRAPEFLALVDHLHDLITGHELPDAPPIGVILPHPNGPAAAVTAPPNQPQVIEPLPPALPGEIVGLIEWLAARRGEDDLARIAADTGHEFSHIIVVAHAAEQLALVETPRRQVRLTPLGVRFAAARAEERQQLWRAQLLTLRLIANLETLRARQPGGRLDCDIVLEQLVLAMPHEDYQRQFRTVLAWARYGGLFTSDRHHEQLIPVR